MGVLDQVRRSVAKSVYMPDDELAVFATALVASHAVGFTTRAPRIMLSSDQGGFGKSQALRFAERVVPDPWYVEGKSDSQAAIKSHLMRPGRPTLLMDEAAKVFGKSGRLGATSPLYTLLTAGYDAKSKVSVSVSGVDEQASAYCMAFVGGLGTSLPEDALSRTIRLKMVKRPKHIALVSVDSRGTDLDWLATPISGWVNTREEQIREVLTRLPSYHEGLVDRTGEIWGLLIAVAAVDDRDELDRMIAAFNRLGLDKPTETRTMDERLLLAAHDLATNAVFSVELYHEIRTWPEIAGFTKRETMMMLSRMIGPAKTVRQGNRLAKGWSVEHLEMMLSLFKPSEPVPFVPDEYDAMSEEPVMDETSVTTDTQNRR